MHIISFTASSFYKLSLEVLLALCTVIELKLNGTLEWFKNWEVETVFRFSDSSLNIAFILNYFN